MGLIARALEIEGIATTVTSWNGQLRLTGAPRATLTRLNRGATLGEPGNGEQQRRVLEATLALLAQEAPVGVVPLDETAD